MLNIGTFNMTLLPSTAVILLAGGRSTRMGGGESKVLMDLNGKPVIHYSLEAFLKLPCVIEICIVCPEEARSHFPDSYTFALPGERRQDSVYNGLKALQSNAVVVAVHDGARPLIDALLAEQVIRKASETGAAICAVPVKSTIKYAGPDHFIQDTPPRHLLWEAQTPQTFFRSYLEEAFDSPVNQECDAVDDAFLVERIGRKVAIVQGSYKNIKLTTPEDLAIAASLLASSPK